MSSQAYFDDLITDASQRLTGDEILLASFAGEDTDFVRFNHGDVRQAGTVNQAIVDLDLIERQRHVQASVQLTLDAAMDRVRLDGVLRDLRGRLASVSDDPFLMFNTEVESSNLAGGDDIPDSHAAVGEIRHAAAGRDLVGIYTAGRVRQGFANSLGQRNWFESSTFNFDWTFYLRADKAAKNMYAGFEWDDDAFARKIEWSGQQLEALDREPVDLEPGRYRTYLAPAAVHEVIELVAFDAFGIRDHRTMQSPLLHMVSEGATLAPGTRISEDTAGGVAPNFQEHGFIRPDEVVFVDDGKYRDTLVSPRSAREYDVATNGASTWEYPESLSISPGELPSAGAMAELGTGLFVGNLHYTNYSDRPAGRITGMTRFATLWVENGKVVAPLNVMRFDETIYHMLGDKLIDFTRDREFTLDPDSYGLRSTGSTRLPGALIDDFKFTL